MPSTMTSSPSLRPFVDDDVAALLDAGRHAPLLDLLGVVDHHDVMAGLIEQDRGLRHHQRRVAALPRSTMTPTMPPGISIASGFGNCARTSNGVGVGLDLDVEEIGDAGMRIDAAVGQLDMNGHMRVLVGRRGDPALVFDDVGLARLKSDVDRILADDRRQHCRMTDSTRLPTVKLASPIRPSIGERISV